MESWIIDTVFTRAQLRCNHAPYVTAFNSPFRWTECRCSGGAECLRQYQLRALAAEVQAVQPAISRRAKVKHVKLLNTRATDGRGNRRIELLGLLAVERWAVTTRTVGRFYLCVEAARVSILEMPRTNEVFSVSWLDVVYTLTSILLLLLLASLS